MNEYIELILNIMLHFIGACIAGVILFFMIGHAIEQLRALYDKTLWDTREKARVDLGRQIVNGSSWFTEDEYKLIKTIGESIVNNNGQFSPSSARDEWCRLCINRKDKK